MNIRLATIHDLPSAFNKFVAFESCSDSVKVVPHVCVRNYTRFIEQGIGGLILACDNEEIIGGLGYIIANDLHSGKKYAVETLWLMLPDHRGGGMKLLNKFEQIAEDNDCDECAMIHLMDSMPDSLDKVYAHKGYKLVEKHFIKVLNKGKRL